MLVSALPSAPTDEKKTFKWDQRLLTFDTRAINYILTQAPQYYPKPWQTRLLLTRILGEGVATAEGEQHRRQVSQDTIRIVL